VVPFGSARGVPSYRYSGEESSPTISTSYRYGLRSLSPVFDSPHDVPEPEQNIRSTVTPAL